MGKNSLLTAMRKNAIITNSYFNRLIITLLLILCVNTIFAQNLITNGCFESGGFGTGFNSNYANGGFNTQSTVNVNTGATNNTADNAAYSNCPDHTLGTTAGSTLVVQGANFANTGSKIYEAKPTSGIPVTSGASYTFTYWIESLTAGNPANISVQFNGGAITPTLTVGSATAPNTTCNWQQVTYTFVANSSTVQIWIFNSTSTQSAFAFDDISLVQSGMTASATGTNPVCPGGTGTINAVGTGGSSSMAISCGTTAPTYTYSDGGAYQASSTFSGLSSGTYTVSIADAIGDTAIASPVTITVPTSPLTVSNDTTLNCGDTATLLATGTDAAGYVWNPGLGLTSTTIDDPRAFVVPDTSSILYTVSSSIPIADAIVNGNFSAGNTGFSSNGYTAFNVNNPSRIQGAYAVTSSPAFFELDPPTGFTFCGDHTQNTADSMLVVDGATVAGSSPWTETVSVVPGATYTFTYWIQSISGTGPGTPPPGPQVSPAVIQTLINGTTTNITGTNPITAPSIITCGNWTQVVQTWTSGANTTATISLIDNNLTAAGNDFALDDISFTTTATCPLSDTVRVSYNCVLPIHLLSFTATKQATSTLLNWATGSEQNSSHFIIQKSTNDGSTWLNIGSVNSAGNSITTQNYSFIDNNLTNGISYYRLQQVDADGSYTYSPVAMVENLNVTTIKIYPNPVTDELYIATPQGTTIISAVVIDAIGQTMLVSNNFNNITNSIHVQNLPAGFYNIKLIDNKNQTTNFSFIKK